jgi:hypothetical protein
MIKNCAALDDTMIVSDDFSRSSLGMKDCSFAIENSALAVKAAILS